MTAHAQLLVTGFMCLVPSPGAGQATQRVSIDSVGVEANGRSQYASVSADGRFVVFTCMATNLAPGVTSGFRFQVYLHDRNTGATSLISRSPSGEEANDHCWEPSISADGSHICYYSPARNLISGLSGQVPFHIYLFDRIAGVTELVSVNLSGAPADASSGGPEVSPDGRFVAFHSDASDLVVGDAGFDGDVFVRDRLTGTTERISLGSTGQEGNHSSVNPSISPDGRFVAFLSYASNLVPNDTNGEIDVFLRDRMTGSIQRVSVASDGTEGNDECLYPLVSANGDTVFFSSGATNLVAGDTNGREDVFARNLSLGTTERVSLNTGEGQANNKSQPRSISADGRFVTIFSLASNLVPGDTNGRWDVFIRDRLLGTTERVNVSSEGSQSSADNWPYLMAAISSDGRWVAFDSFADDLVTPDTNQEGDIFVRDRETTGFRSLCDPGIGGVVGCPCSNPPSAPPRGCDNSAATGGALLSASGMTSLSADTLVFMTSDQKPVTLSIALQGTAYTITGLVFGQGIRCVGGALKRLYAKPAVGGSITAPDFGAGDLSVSAQSAAKGDTILPGQSRWYVVYYRDAQVLGGCPSTSTFNSTQTGHVLWLP